MDWKLNESNMKITELEILMEQSQKNLHPNPNDESSREKKIKQLEDENVQLKLRCEDVSKE